MIATETILAFVLVLVRTGALVLAAPVFGEGLGFSGYKIGLIVALSTVSFLSVGDPLAGVHADLLHPLLYGAMALRELLIGTALAMVLQAVLLAVRVTGELIGNEMAFSIASTADPVTGVSTPLLTRLYEVLFLLGLFSVNGHHLLVRALVDSFQRAEVGDLPKAAGTVELVRDLFGDLFAAGVTFAAPVLILLTLASALIGLLARAVPHLNVLEVGFTLRIALGLGAMYLFAPLIAPALAELYAFLSRGLEDALLVLES